MSLPRLGSEAGHGHASCGDVTNHRLVFLSVFQAKEFTVIQLGVVSLLKWRGVFLWSLAKESLIGLNHIDDILARGKAQVAMLVTEVIRSQMVGHISSSLELEAILGTGESVDNGFRILASNDQVINAGGNALIVKDGPSITHVCASKVPVLARFSESRVAGAH